jgi:hypothetical protein
MSENLQNLDTILFPGNSLFNNGGHVKDGYVGATPCGRPCVIFFVSLW